MSDLWTQLQTGVFSHLNQDAGFKATKAAYYVSDVPANALYPYVATPGDSLSQPWYTMGSAGGEELLWSFHVWCDKDNGGPSKVRTVGKTVMEAMDDELITVTGFTTLMFRRVLSTMPMRQDGDPNLFQQVIRYRVMLQGT